MLAKSASIELTIETIDHAHVGRVVGVLEAAGYPVRLDTSNGRGTPLAGPAGPAGPTGPVAGPVEAPGPEPGADAG